MALDTDFGYLCSDLDLRYMSLGEGHDTPLGHGQLLVWNIIQIRQVGTKL